jgi:hypothetical protein
MTRPQPIKDFIRSRNELFWYSPEDKGETVGDELLVETILNYGSMDDVRQLFALMGVKNVARIFFDSINTSERRKNNYFEPTRNYFTLLFNKYAQ